MPIPEPDVDVVSRLREGELHPLRVQAEAGLHGSALKSLYERGEGQELVRQQYTGRYPFELLQNANDAARDAGTRGRAHFLLTDSALIVADNGFGFGDEQVDAICSLGRSSKGPGESVGHKGLGFKSVGEITDHPQINSARASFQFSSERVWREVAEVLGPLPQGQKLPTYAFPFAIEAPDFGPDSEAVEKLRGGEFTTVIRLPFNEGMDRSTVEAHLLANLQSRLLLFLPHVDHLELRGTRGDFSSEVSRDVENGAEHVLLDTDGTSEEWLIYRGSVTPEVSVLAPLGDTWKQLEEAKYAVALPLDQEGQPLLGEELFPLHVYFPTDERPGLRIAVHAEWILTMDRRQIATTPEAVPFNQLLVRAVTDFLATTVAPDLIERYGASANAVAMLIPAGASAIGEGGSSVRARWTEALQASAFLPSADGQIRTPAQIRPLPRTLPDPVTAHEIAALDLGHTLRPDIEAVPAVRDFICGLADCVNIGVPEFLSLMNPPSRETATTYYSFIVSWREASGPSLGTELKRVPSVLGVNGQVFTPEHDTIFFPRERGEVALPEDLPIPVAYVPDVAGVRALLSELSVRPFEWRELIRDYLIKILSDPATTPELREGAMAGLRAYHGVRLSGSEDLEPVLGQVLLPARTADGDVAELRPAANIYLSAPWTGSSELETIYGPFGVPEFLDIQVPANSEQRDTDLEFYLMLGVASHPRLDEVSTTDGQRYILPYLRHPHRGSAYEEWMGLAEVKHAARCSQGHPERQQLRLSYRLDRHDELTETQDPVRLMALWNQLADRWGSVYEHGMEALFYCVHGSHAGERGRRAPSLFAYTLRSRPWVPIDRGNVAELVRPRDAWIGAAQTPRRIQQRIPRISEAMYRTHGGPGLAASLQLADAGRPQVTDLLALLESIANEAEAVGSTNREIDQAARWVQRSLHDVLRDEQDPHPSPQDVRLLASQNGMTRFVAQPPYAEDPLLRDTFEKQRPLLSAEAGLNKLTRYLGLTKLDDVVKTSALPLGEHHDAQYNTVNRRINSIKAHIFALVRSENSSAENRVRPALRTLELVVCDKLVLNYQYDGTEISREDAVCYIASRQERRGHRPVNVGTAYLELDASSGLPHWFPFGRQLAQHLNVPTLADACTMLLTASPADRERMMADRQISAADIEEARKLLRISTEEEEELINVLDTLVPEPSDEDQSEPTRVAALNTAAVTPVTAQVFEPDVAGKDAESSATALSPRKESSSTPVPVDYQAVQIVDAIPGVIKSPATSRPGPHVGAGGSSKAPTIQNEEENRRIGKRGEEIAYNAERQRLAKLGRNPESVRWISKVDELSPYDIMSVDDDDQLIYIEVKSTRNTDPADSFYISHAELIEASYRRSRFYIYRVTNVDAQVPVITRWADPLGLIKEGLGQLLLAKAQMSLAIGDHEFTGTAAET